LTSETESFGLAALEAMACEVPVISSNSGGYQVNIDGVTGYMSNVGDVEDMAKTFKIFDDEVLKEFKANALNALRGSTLIRFYQCMKMYISAISAPVAP
jgi:glycosyltransferase involved in cell wall biosynthesis